MDGLPERGQRWVNERELAATIVTTVAAGPAVELVARALQGADAPAVVNLPLRVYAPGLERR